MARGLLVSDSVHAVLGSGGREIRLYVEIVRGVCRAPDGGAVEVFPGAEPPLWGSLPVDTLAQWVCDEANR